MFPISAREARRGFFTVFVQKANQTICFNTVRRAKRTGIGIPKCSRPFPCGGVHTNLPGDGAPRGGCGRTRQHNQGSDSQIITNLFMMELRIDKFEFPQP